VLRRKDLNRQPSGYEPDARTFYGSSLDGISRTLSKIYIKKFFRQPAQSTENKKINFTENESRRWGGGLESI